MITFSDIVKTGIVLWAIWEEFNKPDPPEKTTGITPDAKTGTGYLPLVYGRGLVEGSLVYADTTKKFTMTGVTANSQQTFQAGPSAIPASALQVVSIDPNDATKTITSTLTVPAQSALKLDTTYPADAVSDLLYAQYTIARGDINRVVECLVDGKYLSSPDLGSSSRQKWDSKHSGQAALRIDIHTNGVADEVMTANQPKRKTATFTNIAYASCAFKLNAITPQFTSVPKVKFLIEGRKIRTTLNAGNTAVLAARVYSNNPAWVLLDYLLDCGSIDSSLRITESMLDLTSFKNTAVICDQVIANPDTKIMSARSGKFYNPTQLGNTSAAPYNVAPSSSEPLRKYECNIVLDTSKSISENVKSILLSMPEASLVWSGGKYKLLLDNPTGVVLTDSDLVLSQEIIKTFPPSSAKYNYCTVTFKNESAEFEEEKVSWPPKVTDSAPYRGVGPFIYSRSTKTNWGEENNGANVGPTLLNNYAVWSGESGSFTFSYKLYIPAALADNYILRVASGASSQRVIMTNLETGVTVIDSTATNLLYGSLPKALTAGRYSIVIQCTGATLLGMAGTLTQATSGAQIWNSADQTYTDFIAVPNNPGTYNTLLAEDGYILSSNEVSASGITDYYHAALLAKYTVEKSRDTYAISFSYIITDKLLEPGDIVTLTSKTVTNSVPTRLRVLQVEIDINNICKVDAVYAPVLNSDITEFLAPTINVPVTSNIVPVPGSVNYTAYSNLTNTAIGSLTWTTNDSLTTSYSVYYAKYDSTDIATYELMASDIAATSYQVNAIIPYFSTVFAVRGYRADGSYSDLVLSNIVLINNAIAADIITPSYTSFKRSITGLLSHTSITFTSNRVADKHEWIVNEVIQTTTTNEIIITTARNTPLVVKVRTVDADNIVRADANTVTYSEDIVLNLTSFVFKRSSANSLTAPSGGTYASPSPTDTTWSDGIPPDDGTKLSVWMSSRTFTSDGLTPQDTAWSLPTLLVSDSKTKFEFSVNSTDWHDVATNLDIYMRTTVIANGVSTMNIAKIKGERGDTGLSGQGLVKGICFKRSASAITGTISGGSFTSPTATDWSDGIPSGTDQLYMTTRIFTSNGLTPQQDAWTTPSAISKDGITGQGVKLQFSATSLTNDWHDTPATSDLYMRSGVTTDGTTYTYGGAVLIKGEKGSPGDPGVSPLNAVLSNTYQGIPCDKDGNTLAGAFSTATTTMKVYKGSIDITSLCTFLATKTNVSCSEANTSATQTVNAISANTGSVSIVATETSTGATITSVFTLAKQLQGATGTGVDAVLYELTSDSLTAVKSLTNTYSPTSIIFSSFKTIGNGAKTANPAYWRIYADGTEVNTVADVLAVTSATQSVTLSGTPNYITAKIYSANTRLGASLLDIQMVTIVPAGPKGADSTVPGATGTSGSGTVLVYINGTKAITPTKPTANQTYTAGATTYSTGWYVNSSSVTLGDNEIMYQCEGRYAAGSYTLTWGEPYVSLIKVGTLDAITILTGSLTSNSDTGQKLTINEKVGTGVDAVDSNEFRCINVNGLVASMGDYQSSGSTAETVFKADLPNMKNILTSSFGGFGYTCYLPDPVSYTYPTGSSSQGLRIQTRDSSNNTTAKMFIELGTLSSNNSGRAGYFIYGDDAVQLCNGADAISCSGNITTTGNITGYNGSDERLKHNIVKIKDPLYKLSQISGYTFTWNDDYYAKQNQDLFKKDDIGVIAQEIREVIPEAVHEKENGYLGVDYQKIIPLLIEAIKEQQVQIEELRNDITRLSK
jgi:hypothetical protein